MGRVASRFAKQLKTVCCLLLSAPSGLVFRWVCVCIFYYCYFIRHFPRVLFSACFFLFLLCHSCAVLLHGYLQY